MAGIPDPSRGDTRPFPTLPTSQRGTAPNHHHIAHTHTHTHIPVQGGESQSSSAVRDVSVLQMVLMENLKVM